MKRKEKNWIDEKFGKVCPKCNKRHHVFASKYDDVKTGSQGGGIGACKKD